jgi:hypothetical protein
MRRSDETMRDDQRNHLLLRAAAEGQLPRIQHLLRLGSDIDFSDDTGFTALHHAVLSGFEDCVQELIKQGSDVNATTRYGTSLNLAAQKERLHVASILLRARADQRRALNFAAKHGQDVSSLRCFLESNSLEKVTPTRALENIAEEVPQRHAGLTMHAYVEELEFNRKAADASSVNCSQLTSAADLEHVDEAELSASLRSQIVENLSAQYYNKDHTNAQNESTIHTEYGDGFGTFLQPKQYSTASLALFPTNVVRAAMQQTAGHDKSDEFQDFHCSRFFHASPSKSAYIDRELSPLDVQDKDEVELPILSTREDLVKVGGEDATNCLSHRNG